MKAVGDAKGIYSNQSKENQICNCDLCIAAERVHQRFTADLLHGQWTLLNGGISIPSPPIKQSSDHGGEKGITRF